MSYEAAFSIAAILLSVQIVVNYIKSSRVSNAQSFYFIVLVVDNAITALSSVVKWAAVALIDETPITLINLCSHIYFVTHFLVVFLMFFYLFSTIKTLRELSLFVRGIIVVPAVVILLAILSNPFTQIIFHHSADGVYHRDKGVLLVYFGFVYYMGLILFALLYFRKNFSSRRRNIILIILALGILSTVIQLFYLDLVVECCAEAVCALILLLFIENPSERLNPELDVLSSAAFVDRMKYNLVSRKRFDMVELILPELGEYEKSAGQNATNALLKAVAYYLSTLADNINIYCIDKGAFAMEIISPHSGEVSDIIKKIRERFERTWGGEEIRQRIRMLHIVLPAEMKDITLMQGVMKAFESSPQEISLMSTADFDLNAIIRNKEINGALTRAMERNVFEMRYTPVYSQILERVVAAEVSLRFFDEELGYVYDDELFRFAQRSGHVMQLGELIFEHTCRFIREYELDKQGLSFLAIRLHSSMCLQYHVLERLKEIIDKYEVDPKMLCLMLSEYTVSTASKDFKESVAELEKTGVRICLEDYGSGFTSITSIFEMPFSVLKINHSVMKAALENEKARITMDSTLMMARELNMMTMVEGIDDERRFNMIDDMACDLAKGNYFYEQLLEEEFLQVIHLKAIKGGEDNR
ncbi:MAG: EAL domain-containing protein [Lachnospiraceae bacterium]|nr:EAL domain-containing protein [Lachnospiraceae bacterium]